jgi:DNA repair ATPase RecN
MQRLKEGQFRLNLMNDEIIYNWKKLVSWIKQVKAQVKGLQDEATRVNKELASISRIRRPFSPRARRLRLRHDEILTQMADLEHKKLNYGRAEDKVVEATAKAHNYIRGVQDQQNKLAEDWRAMTPEDLAGVSTNGRLEEIQTHLRQFRDGSDWVVLDEARNL